MEQQIKELHHQLIVHEVIMTAGFLFLFIALGFIFFQFIQYNRLETKYLNNINRSNLNGADMAELLFPIHQHVGSYLKFDLKGNDEEYMSEPETIVYEESDILNVIKSLGLPQPNWEKAKHG